ncbi:hypothetical protein FGB62_152g028 [Gracilaria domingensis]|nr:hypothetical protein FGB62_152g028 [Gracilaria domingensis]
MTVRRDAFRRFKWDDLTDAEKDAVSDVMTIALSRAGIGVGVVLTTAAVLSGGRISYIWFYLTLASGGSVRKGKRPLPGYIKYGGLSFFSLMGAYIGGISAGPLYAQRILAVPDSRLADELRTFIGDWKTRLPNDFDYSSVQPHAPLPDPDNPGSGADEIPPPPPSRAKSMNTREQKQYSWTDRIGLTKP